MAYTGDETRDGGQTPGPFEEMRRRMAESDLETPGTRKRKRREKKRKWEWTISTTEKEDGDGEETPVGRTPLTAVMLARTPITAIRRGQSVSEDSASEVSEAEERFVPPDLGPASVSEDSEMSDERDEWTRDVRSESRSFDEADDVRPTTSQSL